MLDSRTVSKNLELKMLDSNLSYGQYLVFQPWARHQKLPRTPDYSEYNKHIIRAYIQNCCGSSESAQRWYREGPVSWQTLMTKMWGGLLIPWEGQQENFNHLSKFLLSASSNFSFISLGSYGMTQQEITTKFKWKMSQNMIGK